MCAKVDDVQSAATTSSSTLSANNTKISMFKGKTGFVIPKNKFSGSLVPIFKGVKKSENNDTAREESSTQMQRKTKWGLDLSQDTTVRRGRALAYQTRVDQITQQLKLGSLNGGSQNSIADGDVPDNEHPNMQIDYEKLKSLELERREAIGEILKLNPTYKAPSDYQPVVREAIVPIPVKEHPGFNFVSLIYGPDGDTQKRLEKETETRIEVYGAKSETGEKVEITASDGSEVLRSCDGAYVRISADSYEKVDAAASLIELLLSSVSGNSPASKVSASGDNVQLVSEAKDIASIPVASSSLGSQELIRPIMGMGPMPTSSQGPFTSHPGSWFPPPGQSNTSSGLVHVPTSMSFPFNPSSSTHVALGPRPVGPYGFGSSPQATMSPGLRPPVQVMQGRFAPPSYPSGQTPTPFVTGHQPTAVGHSHSARVPAPQLGQRASMTSPPGWAQGSVVSQSPAPPSAQQFPSPQQVGVGVGPTTVTSYVPSQIRSSSAMPVQSFAPLHSSATNAMIRPGQIPPPQSGVPRPPALVNMNAPSFTPLKPMGGASPRPLLPSQGGDFTFQPHRPQGPRLSPSVPGPGAHLTSQRPSPVQLPPAPPQVPSFRPALQNPIPHPVRQNFPRPQIGNQMGPPPGQFGPPSPNPNMGQAPQMHSAAGPFPPRVGHPDRYQQNYRGPPLGRPGGHFVANQHSNPSGRPQVYDPFSPTAARPQGSNISMNRKQEPDPEYEDLMASVGVK